jgi:hypothetical protein
MHEEVEELDTQFRRLATLANLRLIDHMFISDSCEPDLVYTPT